MQIGLRFPLLDFSARYDGPFLNLEQVEKNQPAFLDHSSLQVCIHCMSL